MAQRPKRGMPSWAARPPPRPGLGRAGSRGLGARPGRAPCPWGPPLQAGFPPASGGDAGTRGACVQGGSRRRAAGGWKALSKHRRLAGAGRPRGGTARGARLPGLCPAWFLLELSWGLGDEARGGSFSFLATGTGQGADTPRLTLAGTQIPAPSTSLPSLSTDAPDSPRLLMAFPASPRVIWEPSPVSLLGDGRQGPGKPGQGLSGGPE